MGKSAFNTLQGDHDKMHLELESLARHYIAAVPPLPGLGQFNSKVAPTASALSADVDRCSTPKSAVKALGCSPESPGETSFGASPDHPRQLSHVDPTGEG